MGVKELKGELPWTHLRDWAVSFPGQVFLIDAANILFWCALACYPSFSAGDFIPAVAEFHKFAQYLVARKVAMEMFFDGMPNPDKAHEKRRRDEKRRVAMENIASAREEGVEPAEKDKQALVTNTSLYIAMCAKCCSVLQIPFSVCYQEADSGLAARFLMNASQYIVVSADTDMLVNGVSKWVSVKNWWTGEATFIDVTPKGLEAHVPQLDENDDDKHPLLTHFQKSGAIVFVIWAAVIGCDFTEEASGILGTGPVRLKAIFDDIAAQGLELTIGAVASRIHSDTLSCDAIIKKIDDVQSAFTKAKYYNTKGGVWTLDGKEQVSLLASESSMAHMRGALDPKTGGPYEQSDKAQLEKLSPGLLRHNHEIDKSKVRGAVLPRPPEQCDVLTLRDFITARSGTSSGLFKRDLVMIASAYLEVEKEVEPFLVDRTDVSGLMLSKLDSLSGKDARVIIAAFLEDPGVRASLDPFPLQPFLMEFKQKYDDKLFSEDPDDIVLHAPEMRAELVDLLYSHLGGAGEKKCVRESFEKSCELDGVIYHAMAILPDGRVFLVSKQRASLSKDEKTRNQTDKGEKPLPVEYLVLMELGWQETTAEHHGHNLGILVSIMRSWCPCTAGRGSCVHRGMALWTQLHHWGPDRPTDKPCTASLCGWSKGSRKRQFRITRPVSECTFEQIDKDKPTKQHRGCREAEDAGSHYEVMAPSDRAYFETHVGPQSMAKLCAAIAKHHAAASEDEDEGYSDDE